MMTIHEKLFEIQCKVGAISKDSDNPFYKSKYFDINKLIAHIQPLLQEYKLILLQPIEAGKVRSVIIDTESKDSVWSEMQLPDITDPQKMGSAITYYRRYTLQSLLALQAEDDDGNVASKANKKKPVLKPDTERWVKAVHAIASGGTDINFVKQNYTISKEHAERLLTEALEIRESQ